MKIDLVLTAGNIHPHYTHLYPLVYKIWKKHFNLDCYLILISENIPDYLNDFKDYIILWNHNSELSDIYVAQVIRILYPALFPDKNILITDLDIFPVKYTYFITPIEKYPDNYFISYTDRYIKNNMLAICYNIAKGSIWGEIFNIKNKEDIINRLNEWYTKCYTGIKNCPGWYTDQQKLFTFIKKWNNYKTNVIILKDKDIGFKRLHNRQRDKVKLVKNFEEICKNIHTYSDIHAIKPYHKTAWYLRTLVDNIIN